MAIFLTAFRAEFAFAALAVERLTFIEFIFDALFAPTKEIPVTGHNWFSSQGIESEIYLQEDEPLHLFFL